MNEEKGALFSKCELYRYQLWRIWEPKEKIAMCIGLNPSTANWEKDDPTIKKLREVLKHNGYGGFYMTNLYALVSSKPDKLFATPDSSGLLRKTRNASRTSTNHSNVKT